MGGTSVLYQLYQCCTVNQNWDRLHTRTYWARPNLYQLYQLYQCFGLNLEKIKNTKINSTCLQKKVVQVVQLGQSI